MPVCPVKIRIADIREKLLGIVPINRIRNSLYARKQITLVRGRWRRSAVGHRLSAITTAFLVLRRRGRSSVCRRHSHAPLGLVFLRLVTHSSRRGLYSWAAPRLCLAIASTFREGSELRHRLGRPMWCSLRLS